MTLFVTMGGFGLGIEDAIAQTVPNIQRDPNTGAVWVDNNAFDLRTGDFENSSNIPLPAALPITTAEKRAQATNPNILAPNSVELTSDFNYISDSLNSILNQNTQTTTQSTTYQIQPESLQLTTQFDLRQSEGRHAFGEGIEATVYAPDGSVISRESVFVRGDRVQIGPDGNPLPAANQLTVNYGVNDWVDLRVLNLRQNNGQPSESGIYFSADGEFVVEDLPNGGDLDFNDGEYVQISGGQGEAAILSELAEVSIETRMVETPLDPALRQEEVVETDILRNLVLADTTTSEERDWGEVATPDAITTRLGHATGARTAEDEQLVYSRYAAANEVRLGSDGLGVTGQLSPLVTNPNVPPTLITGNVTFNPTVGDNEAGLTTTVGITQFLNPTHQVARDLFGNEILTPDGTQLLEPAGAFSNRLWVGYVPPEPDKTVRGEQLFSVNGIFELPAQQAVEIAPASPDAVGRGNAAYTRNVGGLLIEETSGAVNFVPQWTEAGYAEAPIVLDAGAARRIIYALVPQQPGQTLQLGQRYAVTNSATGYRIADGDFTVISADRQPQNFSQEMAEVYAVEDTLPGRNMATDIFNGVQGVYIESTGAEPLPTVDVALASEADARVGNTLFPLEVLVGDGGQMGYAKTTRSAGLYLGGALTVGIGNQEDTVRRVETSVERATDQMRMRRTVNTFVTPLFQRESVVQQITATTRNSGTASFDINAQGELTNVKLATGEASETQVTFEEISRTRDIVQGEEFLVSSVTAESRTIIDARIIERDQQTTTETDSYANFSAVQGELALGGMLNFGNTPWTAAANTVRAELFANDTVFGRSGDGIETGWRTEVLFHPFGEVQREAYYYDTNGKVMPLYQTEAVMDASGQQQMQTLMGIDGAAVVVPVNQFVLDEAGDRVAQTVGTGRAKGPGVYLRLEDAFGDDEGVLIAGGAQFAF